MRIYRPVFALCSDLECGSTRSRLSCMRLRFLALTPCVTVLVLLSSALVEISLARSFATSDVPQAGVVIAKLSRPVYPPLAQTAHITGEVDLTLGIRRDGTIESAVVVKGPPLLQQSALASAQQSQFECRGCGEAVTSYSLTYTFQLVDKGACTTTDTLSTEVIQSQNHVTVVAPVVWICDPPSFRKVRSAKCLYLWRCSSRR